MLFVILLILITVAVLISFGIFWQVVLSAIIVVIILSLLKWLFGKLSGGR
jgi:hypothetical protein